MYLNSPGPRIGRTFSLLTSVISKISASKQSHFVHYIPTPNGCRVLGDPKKGLRCALPRSRTPAARLLAIEALKNHEVLPVFRPPRTLHPHLLKRPPQR